MLNHNTHATAVDIREAHSTRRVGGPDLPGLGQRYHDLANTPLLPKSPFGDLLPYTVVLWAAQGFLCYLAAFQSERDAVKYAKLEAASGDYLTGTCFVVPKVGHAGVNCANSLASSFWCEAPSKR